MMISKDKVAFIIVCWNNENLLADCLKSIDEQSYTNHTTILVDNGSSDNSVATASKLMPDAKIIKAGKNLGFAKGNNIGIAKALEDKDVKYIALLNTDARVEKNWLKYIIEFAKHKSRGACYQGTTLDYYNESIIDSTHIYLARNGQATQGNWRKQYTSELGPKKVFGVNAAACVISRVFIEAQPFGTKLFDETMFMYLEDVDVAARATVMRWDNYLVPHARALHMGSASSGKNPNFSLYMTFRNNSGLIVKNFSWRMVLKIFSNIPSSDIDTFKHLRSLGKKSASWSIVKGRIVGVFYLPIYMLKRHKMNKYRKVDNKYLWSLMDKGF